MENLDLGTNDEEDEDEDEEDIASPVAVVFMILVPVYLLWVYHSYDRLGKPEAKSQIVSTNKGLAEQQRYKFWRSLRDQ